MSTAAHLRLLSDLKAISREPPDGCSASPVSDDNLYVWVRGALLDHLCAQPSRHVERMECSCSGICFPCRRVHRFWAPRTPPGEALDGRVRFPPNATFPPPTPRLPRGCRGEGGGRAACRRMVTACLLSCSPSFNCWRSPSLGVLSVAGREASFSCG